MERLDSSLVQPAARATVRPRPSKKLVLAAILLILPSILASTVTDSASENDSNNASPSSTPLSVDVIVGKLQAANARRAADLLGYRGKRSYKLNYQGFPGSRDAQMVVEATYIAPDKKDFKVISESGSKVLLNRVFVRLMDSEKEALGEQARQQTELSPRNYEFALVDTQHTGDGDFYVLAVVPREKTKFLYQGKIWVDAHDFAVVRIEAEPAKNPSFWISRTEIQHRYQKIGEFWLPAYNQSITQVRLGGKAVLTIDYMDYEITAAKPH